GHRLLFGTEREGAADGCVGGRAGGADIGVVGVCVDVDDEPDLVGLVGAPRQATGYVMVAVAGGDGVVERGVGGGEDHDRGQVGPLRARAVTEADPGI